ncbi:hypothetical protein RBH29_11365 [Herbivorax sp. ANBcel31]|uniref:hypothetical protein n=1 Tax=Herbivorax sp. ANBcel31 TaxID=3069754 RepID=UPI0027B6010E|nr:hypothetical protein [Herbivorax sp. ANBcel31]MDQ2087026.1 hypothetical protein [Herbivorax sp. ANBcel31]
MRTVFAFFHQADRNNIVECLNTICTNNQNIQWVYLKKGDVVLYIEFDDKKYLMNDLYNEEEQETQLLLSLLQERELDLILQIDISGRHSGTEEVIILLKALLSKFDGVAIDDYTSHAWTLDEIANGYLFKNHLFFDYDGWYKENTQGDI